MLVVFAKRYYLVLLVTACLSLLLIALSIFYYFAIFLPQNDMMKRNYESEIKKIRQETSDLQDSLEDIQNTTNESTPEVNQEEIQNSVQDAISDEMENQANCERLGGRYQGSGTCVYY